MESHHAQLDPPQPVDPCPEQHRHLPLYAAEPAACKNIRLGVVNWTDVIATSAMAQVLLDGLGYQTKQTSASQQIIFAGIRDKRLDMFLGYWNPIMTQTITPFIDANQVKVLEKPSLEDARATLAVPKYLYDKGLKTFADIHKFEKSWAARSMASNRAPAPTPRSRQ